MKNYLPYKELHRIVGQAATFTSNPIPCHSIENLSISIELTNSNFVGTISILESNREDGGYVERADSVFNVSGSDTHIYICMPKTRFQKVKLTRTSGTADVFIYYSYR